MIRINVPTTFEERKSFGHAVQTARGVVAMSASKLARQVNEAPSWVEKVELAMVRLSRSDVDALHEKLPHLHRYLSEEPTP